MPLPIPVEPSATGQSPGAPASRSGYIFGVPMGELGWFTTLLMSLASGFAAFFAATFVGIVGLLVYNTAMHGKADYAISYRLVGLPAGLLVLVVVGAYLGTLWVKRMFRRG